MLAIIRISYLCNPSYMPASIYLFQPSFVTWQPRRFGRRDSKEVKYIIYSIFNLRLQI